MKQVHPAEAAIGRWKASTSLPESEQEPLLERVEEVLSMAKQLPLEPTGLWENEVGYQEKLQEGHTEEDAQMLATVKNLIFPETQSSYEQAGHISQVNMLSSTKLQLSINPGTLELLKCWSSAESRTVTSLATYALEVGLRQMKANGEMPQAAVDRYEKTCRKRIASDELSAALHGCLHPLPF